MCYTACSPPFLLGSDPLKRLAIWRRRIGLSRAVLSHNKVFRQRNMVVTVWTTIQYRCVTCVAWRFLGMFRLRDEVFLLVTAWLHAVNRLASHARAKRKYFKTALSTTGLFIGYEMSGSWQLLPLKLAESIIIYNAISQSMVASFKFSCRILHCKILCSFKGWRRNWNWKKLQSGNWNWTPTPRVNNFIFPNKIESESESVRVSTVIERAVE